MMFNGQVVVPSRRSSSFLLKTNHSAEIAESCRQITKNQQVDAYLQRRAPPAIRLPPPAIRLPTNIPSLYQTNAP